MAIHKFLHDRSQHIASDGELDIQTAGYTKQRLEKFAEVYVELTRRAGGIGRSVTYEDEFYSRIKESVVETGN